MTISAHPQTPGTPLHSEHLSRSSDVGNGAKGLRPMAEAGYSLGDLQREVAIQHEAREVEHWMRRYAETNCFSDRGAADRARLRMEALIRGRSPAMVARMERERGLA